MANFDDLEIEFDLDLDPQSLGPDFVALKKHVASLAAEFDSVKDQLDIAKKQLSDLADTGKGATDDLGDGHVKFGRRVRGVLDKVRLHWSQVRDTVVAAGLAVVGLLQATKAAGQEMNVMSSLSPIDKRAIEEANKALGGTVDKLKLAQTLQQTNLSTDQFADAAKAAAFMAKQFGFSKEHMLDAIHNGTLMETQLQAIGISAKHLENEIQAASAAMGAVGGELDDVTKSQIRAKVTIDAIRKASDGWRADTKQTGDEASRVLAQLGEVTRELKREIMPTAVKLIRWLTKAARTAKEWHANLAQAKKEITDSFNFLGRVFSGQEQAAKRAAKAAKERAAATQQQAYSQAEVKKGLAALFAIGRKYMPLAKSIGGLVKDQVKSGLKNIKAQGQILVAEKKRNAAIKQRNLLQAELRRQRIEELRQLQGQAKDFLRNSVEKQIQTIADMGGSFGEVASGLTDLPEKFRIFSSLPGMLKGINAAIDVAGKFQGKKNVDIAKEIQLRQETLKLNTDQAKAAKMLGMWIQGSALDSREYLGNEKAATAAIRASLSDLSARAKLAQIVNERNNVQKDITQFALSAEMAKNVFLGRQGVLLEKLVTARGHNKKVLEAELRLNGIMIARLQRTSQQFRAQAKERGKLLNIQQQIAQLELQSQVRQKKIAADRGKLDDLKRLTELRNQLRAINPQDGDAQAAALQNAAFQISSIKLEMREISDQAKFIEGKLAKGLFANTGDSERAKAELEGLKARLKMRQREIQLIGLKAKAEVDAISLAGHLRQLFAQDAINLEQKMAASIHGSFQSLLGGFTETVLGAFEALASGEQDIGSRVGKGFLDALAGVAAQLGGVFLAAGAGKLALFDPSGFAAIGAGTALIGIAASLKAASGLVSAPAPSSGGGRSLAPPSAPQPNPQTGPGAPPVREIKETIVLPTAPWLGSEEGQRRAFDRWHKRTDRTTAVRGGGRY